VPGFEVKIVDEDGNPVAAGETGHLLVRGSTSAKFYWNQHARSRATFEGYWTRTGDRFRVDDNGDYVYAGRADDMLKVGGIYVSPIEVESALIAHPAVHEAAVVGKEDSDRLVKPMAYVVLANGFLLETLTNELKTFVRRISLIQISSLDQYVPICLRRSREVQRFKLRAACNPTS
jgi:benzoate-CoA ligase